MTPRLEPASFSVTAATFTGNHGAEAMLRATLQGLRERLPGSAFHVFSYYPTEDRAMVRDPDTMVHSLTPLALIVRLTPLAAAYTLCRALRLRVLLSAFPADVRAVAESDALLDLAGVSFVEGREIFLPFNVLSVAPALILGVPVVKLSQAMVPFRRPLNRGVARAVLRRCRALFARGADTREHLAALRLGDRIRQAPDVAFLLEPGQGDDPRAEVLDTVVRRRPAVRSVVGVCPSSLLAGKVGAPYLELLEKVVGHLVAEGDLILLFPNASRGSADAGPRNNDLHVIRALRQRLPDAVQAAVVAVEGDVHAPEILTLLSAVDLALVSRFHAMVGALSTGRPVAVVGWSHKYAEVMGDFGMEAHVFDGRNVGPQDVLASLDAFRDDLEGWRVQIADRLPAVRAAAAAQLDYVVDLVGKEEAR